MKLLKIQDNSRQKKSAFSPVEGLTGKIADKTLEQLEREEAAASKSARREAVGPRQRDMEKSALKASERSRDAPERPRAPVLRSNNAKGR